MITSKLLRLVYVCEFLVASIAVFTAWSEVGGQAALDLMNWVWKFGLGFALAAAVVCYSASLVDETSIWNMRSVRWLSVIGLLLLGIGAVTYFYSLQVDAGESDESPVPNIHHAISSSYKTS